MSKMSVADAAEFFGVSKEAIHNRIRRGSLTCEVIDGQKYVDIDAKSTPANKTKKSHQRKTSNIDSKYNEFLEEQNSMLQKKVEKLENETRTLRDQKEQMLIDEREKIESIYKEKDEQLKSVINMISSNLMLDKKPEISESVDAEIETLEIDEVNVEENWSSLNKFLKTKGYKKNKRKKIHKEFLKRAKKGDKSILEEDDKCYIDLNRFTYDL